MAARSAYTFFTSWCGEIVSGIVVRRSDRRFHSAIGMAESEASVHFLLRYGLQSTANLLLKLVSTGSTVWRPSSSAAR